MKHFRKVLCAALAAVLLLGISAFPARAVSVGDSFAPDLSAWGVQNNHGWYYLYRTAGGAFHELTYYDNTASIAWQRNAFASDPDAVGEMYFINQNSWFVGELGTQPAMGFDAPETGTVELRFDTHGQSDLTLTVYLGNTKLAAFTANTTGPNAGFTTQKVTADVHQGDRLSIVAATSGANREVWVKNQQVSYLSVGEFTEPTEPTELPPDDGPVAPTPPAAAAGTVYAPNFDYWGAQNNNCWYYMVRTPAGAYRKMDYHGDAAEIEWQRNAFASDPGADGEMYFINRSNCFTGELGSLPVYAFQCPSGGQVELTVLTHGQPDMTLRILKNAETLETVTLSTTGAEDGFTRTTLTTEVKAGTMLYLVISATGADREAWVKDYSVKYLSVNSDTEDPTDPTDPTEPEPGDPDLYAPDKNAWGSQNNNGWSYQYRNNGGQYADLDFYGSDAAISWQKNAFSFDPNAMNEMLFINRTSCFLGENGSLPVYKFLCPTGGQVELTVLTHGQPELQMDILKNDETLQTLTFSTDGPESGYTRTTLTLDVKQGTVLRLVVKSDGTGDSREAWIRDYSVRYLSRNDQVEEPERQTVYAPDPAAWGTQNNQGWYYMYKGRDNIYRELDYFTESDIEWQRNSFASNPDRDKEMYFISQQRFFYGELKTRPVYGFLCPSGGRVELTVIVHGESALRLDVLKNRELVDTITLSKDGELAGFTKYTYTIDVKKGTWLYLEGYSQEMSFREGYLNYCGVRYLSFNEETEQPVNSLVGKVYTPDMDTLTQNNNGWYYMYYDSLFQNYQELPKYGPYASIEWQRNAFAFDPDLMSEMLLMTNEHYFLGENGSRPVYAFRCPSGGRVRLTVNTHGREDMRMWVYHNYTLKDTYSYNTTGPLQGFTEHNLELDVAKGDWIYLVCGSVGKNRDGWLSYYGVEYLSVNDAVSSYGQSYAYSPDLGSGWGKQDNHGWSFEYLDKTDNLFRRLAYVRANKEFEGTSEGGYEYLLIKPVEMHPSLKGDPAKVFTCQRGGKVQISFAAWLQAPDLSPTGTGIAVYHNGEKIWPEDGYYQTPGTYTIQRLTVDAAKGDDIAIVLDALEDNNSFDATNVRVCAKYLTSNDRVRTEWPVYPEEVRPEINEAPQPSPAPTEPQPETEPVPAPETEAGEASDEQPRARGPVLFLILGCCVGAAALAAGAGVMVKKRKIRQK